ncbi:hypothetical protein FRB99_004419 [Tulasnella sp. 403]|nr:hypothetical protein FRB99_004419 [Tulasnella sp. 403]
MSTAPKSFRTFYNGNQIPWMGFGTGTALFGRVASEPVATALTAGFTHIDAAQQYRNEESVGEALQQYFSSPNALPRSSIFVTTKLDKLTPGQTVRDALKESLGKLKLDYVDLFLVHTPIPHAGRLRDIWKQMEEVNREGLTRNIGVSNYRLKDFDEFMGEAEIIPVCNQSSLMVLAKIELNPYVLKAAEPLLEFHRKHNILTASYGGLTPINRYKGNPLDDILPIIRERLEHSAGKPINDSQVLIKWLLAKGSVPITTSSKRDRLTSLLETLDLPDLTQSEVEQINEAGKKVHLRTFQKHMDL